MADSTMTSTNKRSRYIIHHFLAGPTSAKAQGTTDPPADDIRISKKEDVVLRSQNRTRDLSITIAITVERDKPTTPSGGIQNELGLVVLRWKNALLHSLYVR